ncbi:hypothetical protein LJB93_01045 [Desulfovibrio sp. OttesenSCG-928-F07]|nr:hypothetical protein [Desulfovibrio sp. OttesenSCG-928-F07]
MNKLAIIQRLIRLVVIVPLALLLFDFFSDYEFFFMQNTVSLNWLAVIILVLIPAAISYPYLRSFKLVLYRVALKNLLRTDSTLYKWLSRGFLIQILAALYALAIGASLFVFFACMRVEYEKMLCITVTGMLFILVYRGSPQSQKGILSGVLAQDIATMLHKLALPVVFAWLSALCIVALELNRGLIPAGAAQFFGINTSTVPLHMVVSEAASVVGPEQIASKTIRIMLRHIYLQDLVLRSLLEAEFGRVIFAFLLFLKESFSYLLGIFFILKSGCDFIDKLSARAGQNT